MLTDLHTKVVMICASHITAPVKVLLFVMYRVTTLTVILSVMTPCSLVSDYRCLEGTN